MLTLAVCNLEAENNQGTTYDRELLFLIYRYKQLIIWIDTTKRNSPF